MVGADTMRIINSVRQILIDCGFDTLDIEKIILREIYDNDTFRKNMRGEVENYPPAVIQYIEMSILATAFEYYLHVNPKQHAETILALNDVDL